MGVWVNSDDEMRDGRGLDEIRLARTVDDDGARSDADGDGDGDALAKLLLLLLLLLLVLANTTCKDEEKDAIEDTGLEARMDGAGLVT